MPTNRAELSYKNPYYLPKHRQLELEHFCLQYPQWIEARNKIELGSIPVFDTIRCENNVTDQTAMNALLTQEYTRRIEMIENAAIEADEELASYIIEAVTKGLSYNYMKTYFNIPCCRDVWHMTRRRFFWMLSHYRD